MSFAKIALGLAIAAGALTAAAPAHADQLGDIMGRKELRCGTFADVPPFAAPDTKTREMAGFDVDGSRTAFAIPDNVLPLMVIAVGSLGDYSRVSAEIAERDALPRHRLPLDDMAFGQEWGSPWR